MTREAGRDVLGAGQTGSRSHTREEYVARWLGDRFAEWDWWLPDELMAVARAAGIDLTRWWGAPAVRALEIRPTNREIYPGRAETVWARRP